MNTLRFAFVNFARDWKSGEQAVMAMAVVVAVAALTAIAFFTNRIALGVEQQAGEVLAADLRIESSQGFNDAYPSQAIAGALVTARTVTFPSVVLNGDHSALAAMRAVSSNYPLRGRVKFTRRLDGQVEELAVSPVTGEAWVDARLLAQLAIDVGAQLEIGRAHLTVTRVLIARPDQGTQFTDLAPSVLFNLTDLPRTELIQPGSRASYAMLFAGAPAAVASFKAQLLANKVAGERVIDIEEANPQIRSAIDRAGRFLNLASLVSVLLSAIAVAMAARRYAARRMDVVALMKCMGAKQGRILFIHLLQLLLLAVLASVIGTAMGFAAQAGLAWLLKDLIHGQLPAPSLAPAFLGLATAVIVLTGFALPPLLQLKRVPPVRVLRRDVEAPPLHYSIIYGLAILAVVALVAWIARDITLVEQVMLGMAATFSMLYGGGWLLVKALATVRSSVGVSWRYGIANIARRGRESIVQVVAFGLGLMVLLVLVIVRSDLLDTWRKSLPDDAPNQFLINIQADKSQAIREFFVEHQLPEPTLAPMVRARLSSINDVPIAKWRSENTGRTKNKIDAVDGERNSSNQDRARGFLEREANLTWTRQLPEGNKLVSGEWWRDNDQGGARMSVELSVARTLHLKLGDRVTYDVAGELITAKVANFREVQWDNFRPNFFIVFSPGVIDHAAGTYITSLHVPSAQRAVMRDFTRQFPEVTAIDIDAVITQVRSVMDKVNLAVEYVFLFTLFAGITVLFAAIQSTRDERRYESAMLRTLGASRRVVLQGVAAEFIVLGILAGVMAATGASVAGYLLTRLMNLEYSFDPIVWIAGLIAGVALVGIAGTAVTYSVVNAPPVETLRRSY